MILQQSSASTSDDKNEEGNFLSRMIPPKEELKKLVPLAVMFFCILFSYTILRDTKDVLMVTAPKSGAEVIPFVKTYCNLPIAIVRNNVMMRFVLLMYVSRLVSLPVCSIMYDPCVVFL